MKVILDIGSLRYPVTGIGRYAYELGRALERSGRLEELLPWRGFGPAAAWPEWEALGRPARPSFTGRLAAGTQKYPPALKILLDLKSALLARRLKGYRGRVYHGTNFFLPPAGDRAQAATAHDLSPLVMPESQPDWRRRMTEYIFRELPRRADCLITISEFSRREIIEKLSWPPERIKTAYLAAAEEFRPRPAEELNAPLAGLGLSPGRYSLFVGTVEPRKNIGLLLDVYEGLPAGLRRAFPLVVAGSPGWRSEELHRRMERLARGDWLRYLGYCRDLPALMAGAALFLFPSFYEGFGLPPLEAMQSGVPVIVSDRASLPEVAGEAAPRLPAEDADAWREATRRALEDPVWRGARAAAGLARAAEFSWDRCAAETLSAYEAAAAFRDGLTLYER